jgi:rhodanese-related sulfurtransferase
MMQRQSYKTMVAGQVEEVFPWDLLDEQEVDGKPLLLDIRCSHEFDAAHVPGSVNVPRGILEIAAECGYEEKYQNWSRRVSADSGDLPLREP